MDVQLGNSSAVERKSDSNGVVTEVPIAGNEITHVTLPTDWSIGQAFVAVTDPRGVWAAHAASGTVPTWVSSNDATLQGLLADHYKCPSGQPAPAP